MKAAWGAAIASVGAAAASSACCWLPLAAMLLGFGVGGIGAALERHRWIFVGGSILLFAAAWFLNERAARACAPDGTCPPPSPRRIRFTRVLLGACAVGIAGFAFLPEILAALTPPPQGAGPGTQRELQGLSSGAPELRSAFNRDQGSVRVVVLLAPT